MTYDFTAAERFLKYVTVDTQSDPNSRTSPSSEKQKSLSRLLFNELRSIGLDDVEIDQFGYVYATIPATTAKNVPTICFCAHVDTAPDCSGSGVKPLVHKNYQGQDLVLPDDSSQRISPSDYPSLKKMIGHDIITASGTTLLGADDKAGVAEIVDLANFLTNHPEILHGRIRILFTTDEEVGRGTENLDMQKLGADFGYTLDGGAIGSIEDQTFSADGVTITIHGIISHPGYAKGKMVNALKIAADIVAALPKEELSPEATEKMEGFIHPVGIEGIAERCSISFIIRDFDTAELASKELLLENLVKEVMLKYPRAHYDFSVQEQYRNMKSVLDQHPQVVENAIKAIERAGLEVKRQSIRGGTDGSKLSFMGLPCANLFAAQQAIHSKHEFISIQEMNKAVETLIELVKVWEEEA